MVAITALTIAGEDARYLRGRRYNRPMPQPVTVVQRFQSGHGWGSATGVTQTSNDTSVVGLGTQTMKLVTQANTFGFTRKTAEVAVDLSLKHPRIWLIVEDPTLWGSGASISVLAAPSGGLTSSSYFSWSIGLDVPGSATANMAMIDKNKLICIDLPWAGSFTSGTPAKTAITDWQISINSGSVAGLNLWVAGIEAVPNLSTKFPNGVVTICMDDTYDGHWLYGRPALTKYGYPATLFPIVSKFDTANAMTLAQAQSLHDAFGWEVGAHAMTATTHDNYGTLTTAQVQDDMIQNSTWLAANGFRSEAYAYPLGYFSSPVADTAAAKVFASARSINPGLVGSVPPINPYRIRSQSGVGGSGGYGVTTSGTSGSYGTLSRAAAGSSWVVFTLHQISSGASGAINTCSSADFSALIDSINGLGMAVGTMTQVMDAARS